MRMSGWAKNDDKKFKRSSRLRAHFFYHWNIWLLLLLFSLMVSLVINSLQHFFLPQKNDFSASSFSISFLCNKPFKRKWGIGKRRQHGVPYHKTVKWKNLLCSCYFCTFDVVDAVVVMFAQMMLLLLLCSINLVLCS